MIAGFGCRKRFLGQGLIKKGCNYRQHLLRVHVKHEVAGVRDDGKLSIWNQPRYLQRVLDRDEIVIAARDEDGCFDRFQQVVRKSLPSVFWTLANSVGHCVGSGATCS